ncbi:MAG: DUF4296 domain-containing protein [Calditrichaceae bacterium]
MIKRSIHIYFLILITLLITNFISSCSKKENKLLKDDKFVEVLTDLMIVENLSVQKSEQIKLAQKVFQKYQVDSSAFYRTRRHYEKNEKYWIKIYSKVNERIQVKLDSFRTEQSMPDKVSPKTD